MLRDSNKYNLTMSSALILLLLAPACLADLMCYVCDDCAKVTKETPLLACNADFFNQGGNTEASTVTTTEATTTTMPTAASNTENPVDSTTGVPADTTVMPNINEMSTTSVESTTEPSIESTEAPTPTSDIVDTTPAPHSQLVARTRRAAMDTSVSYHCYTVQNSLNHTLVTNRGCSRVEGQQSVCQTLQLQYDDIQLGKCDPCSMNACNSATSLLRSPLLATLIFALVAFALQRK